jgi:aminopeptidase N
MLSNQKAISESEALELHCGKSFLQAASVDLSDSRKYAPAREIDLLHLILDVTPNFETKTVAVKTTLRFAPIAKSVREIRLDAVDLAVSSVESSAPMAGYQVMAEEIVITFDRPIPPNVQTTVTIAHQAEPVKGLYFRTPDMGYREEDMHLWTQGAPHEARYWYPGSDYPNERFTSEVICHVPEDMVVLSNGRLVSESVDPARGVKTVHWLQDKPHVNYLIALVAGKLKGIHGRYGEISLAFYTPVSQIDQAENSFRDTADMLAFFEQEIGFPYPWDKYYQAVVDDFYWGGMENTSLTILTDRTLFTDAAENIVSGQKLIAHELAHQWFGDCVTCKDWSHVWLNEGFAVYYAHLYDGYKNGRDSMLYGLYQDTRHIFENGASPLPMVYKKYDNPMQQFDYRAYVKGSWVLHMLRTQLGEDLYRQCIKTYLERNAFQSVATEDFGEVIEEITGYPIDGFLDQWVYHAGHPELEVSYSWSEADKMAKITVKQTQALSDNVLRFTFPTKIRFQTEMGVVDKEIVIEEELHEFYFSLEAAPTIVRFDPDYGLLAKVRFDKPAAMLYAQLEDKNDVIGRLLAIEALKSRADRQTVEKLRAVLNEDAFYGVRIKVSEALGEIHNSAAFEALLSSVNQPDARVRRQVAQDLGRFYRQECLAKTKEILNTEKNPEILAVAIRNLGKYPDEETQEILVRFLKSTSYRNRLADAAIEAIHSLDDPAYIESLLATLAEREQDFTSDGLGQGLRTLAYIARREEDKDAVRRFISGYLNHKKERIQIDAIAALGILGDTRAISVVETFAQTRDDSIRRAAEAALRTLRDAREIPVELKELRLEVLEMKKANEQMRKELEDLKKRLDARTETPNRNEPLRTNTGLGL